MGTCSADLILWEQIQTLLMSLSTGQLSGLPSQFGQSCGVVDLIHRWQGPKAQSGAYKARAVGAKSCLERAEPEKCPLHPIVKLPRLGESALGISQASSTWSQCPAETCTRGFGLQLGCKCGWWAVSCSWERAEEHLLWMLEAFYNDDAMIKVPLLCNKYMFDAHYLMSR